MHENDEFLVSPTSCGTAMFPVAFTDEARISIEEYLMVRLRSKLHCSAASCLKFITH